MLGALTGLAIGDALGMPTQTLPRARIRELYGMVRTFEPAPADNEVSRGTPAGRVTDDTDQAVIVGWLLIEGRGRVDPRRFAEELLTWESAMRARGSADLLGPSTRRALNHVTQGGGIAEAGRWGDTNGAAMRVAPVGIAYPHEPLELLVEAVAQLDRTTHDTTVANAGAAAVAAAVSAGIAGAPCTEALDHGARAAAIGAAHGHYVAGADVASRIDWARQLVSGQSPDHGLDLIYRLVGTGLATQESVPAAFAVVALFPADPWEVCCAAASLGGDCDTIAAIAGAIAGACHGVSAFPAARLAELMAANPGLDLPALAGALLDIRRSQP